jgi:IclR family transcriptional regulator, mhp operon transcriptional activator
MGRALETRSLDRGLAILNSLALHGASSLQDLHAKTGLPKSTIRRLLGTLINRKIVRRSLGDQLYRANISLPFQNPFGSTRSEAWLVDRAGPHMIELTRSVGWSCDLHIFERTKSRIVETTRPLSPFFQFRRQIDLEVPVFASAAGLAVLSTWTERAVLALVDEIGEHPVLGLSRLGMGKPNLLSTLRQVRSQGYAIRAGEYRGGSEAAQKLHAIARPIYRDEVAVGALVVLWPKGYLAPDEFAGMHLGILKDTAAAITADLTRGDHG